MTAQTLYCKCRFVCWLGRVINIKTRIESGSAISH
ncbi:Uncharacterised protein [Klebsiella pneumoniae]|nr:Uncharacterised protein [Klebsiella pneumoniae]